MPESGPLRCGSSSEGDVAPRAAQLYRVSWYSRRFYLNAARRVMCARRAVPGGSSGSFYFSLLILMR